MSLFVVLVLGLFRGFFSRSAFLVILFSFLPSYFQIAARSGLETPQETNMEILSVALYTDVSLGLGLFEISIP